MSNISYNLLIIDFTLKIIYNTETFTMEKTAEGIAVDANCAIISLNEYHGNDNYNKQGLGWYLYPGNNTTDILHLIRPRADTISVLEMTGAEIKAMQKAGFDLNHNRKPYQYLLFTRNNAVLEDTSTYRLAISTGELTESMLKKAKETEISPIDAMRDYIKKLKTVQMDCIDWQ